MSMLKTYTYSDFFLNSRKKWVKHKLGTFSQIYTYAFSDFKKKKKEKKGEKQNKQTNKKQNKKH